MEQTTDIEEHTASVTASNNNSASDTTFHKTENKYPLPITDKAVRTRAKARGFKLEDSSFGYSVIDPIGLTHGFGGSLERCAKWIDQWPTITELDQYASLNTMSGEKIKLNGQIEYING